MTVFSIFTLQKFTNFHAIRSCSIHNICNEIGCPRFFAPPYTDLIILAYLLTFLFCTNLWNAHVHTVVLQYKCTVIDDDDDDDDYSLHHADKRQGSQFPRILESNGKSWNFRNEFSTPEKSW